MRYTVILEPEEEGGFHVWCPALKGCHSQGDTKEEAVANIHEAVASYLESLRDGRELISTEHPVRYLVLVDGDAKFKNVINLSVRLLILQPSFVFTTVS